MSSANQPPTLHVDTADPASRPTSPNSFLSPRAASPTPSNRTRDRLLSPFKPASRSRVALDGVEGSHEPPSEQELRDIFEEEEIQRFLNTFHSNIGEVTLPEGQYNFDPGRKVVIVSAEDAKEVAKAGAAPSTAAVEPAPPSVVRDLKTGDAEEDDSDDETDTEVGSEDSWVDVDKKGNRVYTPPEALPSERKHVHVERPTPVWGSEKVAALIVPLLPQGRAIEARNRRGGKHEKFSLGALRLAGQRAYLSTYPFYVPFALNLWDIARWIDWPKSARLCAIYWLMWWNNFLLPGLLFYVVYQLLKHRLLPYPTLEQLEQRRLAAIDAERVGEAIVSVSSHSGPWTSSEGYSGLGSLNLGISNATAAAQANADNMRVTDMVKMAVGAGKGALTGKFKKDKSVVDPEAKMSVVDGDHALTGTEAQQAADWRRLMVLVIEELADLHERLKNLFLWRRPVSTMTYTIILTFGAFAIAFTPAQILAKATYAGLGFFYWFLIPVLCAMTRRQRAMIPSPLYDIPTDAEYAMEVIAQRIATGGSVERPDKKHVKNLQQAYGAKTKGELPDAVLSKTSLGAPLSAVNTRGTPLGSPPAIVYPKEGAIRDFATENDASTIAATEVPGQFPGVASPPMVAQQPQSYSAHHKHIPGIMTLSSSAIEFTPFLRHKPNLQIPLDRIRGVKKSGKRTLFVRFLEPVTDGNGDKYRTIDDPEGVDDKGVLVMKEREDKFKWVGHRDEVFARLVTSKKDHWVPV